jgi:coenzyme F420-reducing hydrogenase gamma subunit
MSPKYLADEIKATDTKSRAKKVIGVGSCAADGAERPEL